MSNTIEVELFNRKQAWAILQSTVFPFLKERLQGGARLVMTVGPRKRTKKQNRRYWGNGVLKQIADQAVVNGKMYAPDIWHELFKRKFLGAHELPDGTVVGASSAGLSVADFCDFCTQVEAYAVQELGVVFYDLEPFDAE